MKKLASLVVFAVVISLASGTALWSAPKVIRVMASSSNFTDEDVKVWNTENPNIQLTREEEDQTKWIADYMAGSPPDLVIVGSGADIPYFATRGLLLDITPYLSKGKKLINDIDLAGSNAYFFEKKWWGLPKDYNNVTSILYNKEIFNNAKQPYPNPKVPMTYAEFFALAQKLAVPEKGIFGTEVHGMWPLVIASDMAYMIGKPLLTSNQSQMNEDAAVRDIWKYFLKLRKEDISSNPKHPITGWAGPAFQAGNIGMVQLGYWFGASSASVAGYQEKFGWAPAPIMAKNGPRVTNNLGATGMVISSKTKSPNEAYAVFEWYMSGKPGVDRAKTGWGIPPLKSLQKLLPNTTDYDKTRKELALEEAKFMKPIQSSVYTRTQIYVTNWKEAEREHLAGNLTADQAIDLFYKNMNKAFALGKEEMGE